MQFQVTVATIARTPAGRAGCSGGRTVRPLEGIRVLEVAMYGFVPSAGAVLAEWGADVDQGRARGDRRPPARAAPDRLLRVDGDPNPNIEHANRGKRRIGLDMSMPEGQRDAVRAGPPVRRVPDQLPARRAPEVRHRRRGHPGGQPGDHLRPRQRARPARRGGRQGRLRHDRLLVPGRNRGHHHPAGDAGHDRPARPAYGDTISGTNLAGGIAAALLKRERTGEPSVVDVSLLGSGLWSMGHTVALTMHLGQRLEAAPPGVHGSPDQSAGRGCTRRPTAATSPW